MEKMKQWVALTVVGVLAVVAAGWFLLVSPKRSEAADVRDQVAQAESEASQLRTTLGMLKAQQKTLPEVQARLANVQAKIPDNPALPPLIRALDKAADEAGVELVSLAPGKPLPLAGAAPAGQVTPSAGGSGAAPAAQGTAPASGGVTAGTLTQIPISVNVVGGYFQIEQFFDRVEKLTRAMKVTGFNLANGQNPVKPDTTGSTQDDGRSLVATITASVYMAEGRAITVPTTPVAGK